MIAQPVQNSWKTDGIPVALMTARGRTPTASVIRPQSSLSRSSTCSMLEQCFSGISGAHMILFIVAEELIMVLNPLLTAFVFHCSSEF